MHNLFHNFIIGLGLSLGFIFGLSLLCLTIFIVYVIRTYRVKPKDLIEPFKDYLQIASYYEKYEEVADINTIINSLNQNILHPLITEYNIEKNEDYSIMRLTDIILGEIQDENDGDKLLSNKTPRNKHKYKVLGRK